MFKTFLSFFAFLFFVSCGDDKCKLDPGNYSCVLTVETATAECGPGSIGPQPAQSIFFDESGDLSCHSTIINDGPIFDGANQIYAWRSGILTGTENNQVAGDLTIRIADNIEGLNACVIYGSMVCKL